ncbi:MAG: RHS repeat-associated core domain-containing protein, partial [Candidatus Nanopelagicales bacterium]|nr:RHS repeat-associated core domain-containing protein [Candidatus Nanopelagicales bacterium]
DTTGDGLTTTKWSWNSDTDHRGLVSGADYQLPGLPDTSTVSYDAAEDPTVTELNGVVSASKTDAAGALSSLVYTTAASGDRSLGAGDGLIVGYAQTTDGLGRARVRDTTTTGAMLADGDLPGSRAVAEYDHAGRLTGASMWLGSTCLSEEFAYGVESTRPTTTTGTTNGVDWKADPVKDCPTPAKTYTTSRVFNSMAQITSGTTPTTSSLGKVTGSSAFTYGYDSLGRVTSLPGAETPVGKDSAVTQTYYVDDSVASAISFDTGSDTWLVRQYGMDPVGRQDTVTETTVTKAKAKTAKQALTQARKANTSAVTTRHYGDDSDSPTWAADTGGTTTQWLPGLDGGVAAILTTTGGDDSSTTGVVPVVSPHGDNANTLPILDDQTSTRVGAGDGTIDGLDLDTWELYDAYGHPINNTVSTSGVANTLGATGSAASTDAPSGDRYGWLGAYQRPTSTATGLIQMGARPYNPNTGQFLSTDPIRGGNANTYTYPVDPVNESDTSGLVCYSATTFQWSRTDTFIPGNPTYYTVYFSVQYCMTRIHAQGKRRFKVTDIRGAAWAETSWLSGYSPRYAIGPTNRRRVAIDSSKRFRTGSRGKRVFAFYSFEGCLSALNLTACSREDYRMRLRLTARGSRYKGTDNLP